MNECLTDNGGCHGNAICNNTEGSHSCECKAGYLGSGLYCIGKDLICHRVSKLPFNYNNSICHSVTCDARISETVTSGCNISFISKVTIHMQIILIL